MQRRWVLPLLFALLASAYLLTLSSSGVGTYHDDGIYLVTAKALAEEGKYHITSLPMDLAQTKYPILFPLMLGGVWWLGPSFPDNVIYLKLVPFAFAILWLVLCALLLRRLGSTETEAIVIVLFIAASPWTLYLATSLLSDLPFVALAIGALYLLEADVNPDQMGKWVKPFLVGLVSGLSYLVSARGITVWVAAVAIYCIRRDWRSGLAVSAGFGICAVPWMFWQWSNPVPANPAYWYYSKLSYETWHIFGDLSFQEATRVILENVTRCAAWTQLLWGFSSSAVNPVVLHAVTWSLTICALTGFVVTARVRIRAVHFWAVLYMGVVVCWIFPPDRFLVAVTPVSLFFMVAGLKYLQSRIRLGATARKVIVWIFLIHAFATSACRLGWDAAIALREDSPTFLGEEPENWPATMELMGWLRNETPENAVVGSCLDPLVYLYSGRDAIRPFRIRPYDLYYDPRGGMHPLGTVEEFRSHLLVNRISYIHISPAARFYERRHLLTLIAEASRSYPRLFRVAKQASDARYFILQVDLTRLRRGEARNN